MTRDSLDGWERIRLQLVGGRVTNERSYAQQKKAYQDPSRTIKFDREKGMKRDYDEVEGLLNLWADWMRKPSTEVQGYPSEAGGGFVPSWKKDSEEIDAMLDAETIERVNAAYDSLSAIYRDAINRHYRLGANVWRFPRQCDFEEAKIMIRVKFVQRGLL